MHPPRLRGSLFLSLVLLRLAGCASTTVERSPDGSFRYWSSRDSNVEGLEIEAKHADGSTIKATLGKGAGSASTVDQVQAQVLLEALKRIPTKVP